jgi:hypothetical protein
MRKEKSSPILEGWDLSLFPFGNLPERPFPSRIPIICWRNGVNININIKDNQKIGIKGENETKIIINKS